MMKLLAILLVFLALAVQISYSAPASVSISGSLSSYLSQYVPNSTISSASFYSQDVGNSSYVVMKSGSNYLVINATGGRFSIMVNISQVSAVLKPYLLSAYYPSQDYFNNISAEMHSYANQSYSSLKDCLIETGLNAYTCTAGNFCLSCQTVPNCKRVLTATGGPTDVFGMAIMNFSKNYDSLNSSYNAFFSTVSGTNESNIGSRIGALSSLYSNISTLSTEMPNNPLFPLPQGFNKALLSSCYTYVQSQAPWYCFAVDYCGYPSFNSTDSASISAQLNTLEALPLSDSKVSSAASASVAYADSFVQPVVTHELEAEFGAFLNSTYPKYNSTLSSALFLNSMYSNATLSSYISQIQATFSLILNKTINQNITAAGSNMTSLLNRLDSLDSKIDAVYMPVYNGSINNTALIAKQELNYLHVPYSLAELAASQATINAELNSRVNSSSLALISSSISKIKSSASGYNPIFSASSFVKSFDGPLVSSIVAGSSGSISSKLSSLPFYSALISFIIGLVVIFAIYSLTYSRFKKRHKIRITHRTRRAWRSLFIVLIILLLVYVYATYAYAASANSFLPINQFLGSIRSSHSVIVAANLSHSINSSTLQCAVSLNNTLSSMGKKVDIVGIVNNSCTISNSSSAQCYDRLLASQEPIIYLNSLGTYYRGMYGNVFHVSGALENGSSCYVDKIISLAK